jgi:hypothetical protein
MRKEKDRITLSSNIAAKIMKLLRKASIDTFLAISEMTIRVS